MTDKELRKLSRLELLELLLEVSKENQKLKEQIESLEAENKTAENIGNLSVITHQVESSLKYVNSLADALKTSSDKGGIIADSKARTKAEPMSDVEIYRRMLVFFANNDDKLNVFPSDIENDVRARIRNILEKRKTN